MKKKTAILLVGALALTAVLSGCGKNKEATEAARSSPSWTMKKRLPL